MKPSRFPLLHHTVSSKAKISAVDYHEASWGKLYLYLIIIDILINVNFIFIEAPEWNAFASQADAMGLFWFHFVVFELVVDDDSGEDVGADLAVQELIRILVLCIPFSELVGESR